MREPRINITWRWVKQVMGGAEALGQQDEVLDWDPPVQDDDEVIEWDLSQASSDSEGECMLCSDTAQVAECACCLEGTPSPEGGRQDGPVLQHAVTSAISVAIRCWCACHVWWLVIFGILIATSSGTHAHHPKDAGGIMYFDVLACSGANAFDMQCGAGGAMRD